MVNYRDFKRFSSPINFLVFHTWPKQTMLRSYSGGRLCYTYSGSRSSGT